MKKYIYWYIFILLIFISCNQKKEPTHSDIKTINFNVEKISHLKIEKLSDIYEPLEMIPLETNDNVVIQKVDKVEIFGNKVYILDKDGAKTLFEFTRNGKFNRKIGRIGNGPGEYISPLDFDVSKETIRILTYNRMIYYDTTGKYLKDEYLRFVAQKFAAIDENNDAYYGSAKEDRIIIANKSGHKKNSYFTYSVRNRIVTSFELHKNPNGVFFNIPFCDTIYHPKKNAVEPYCYLDFGEYAFTYQDFLKVPATQRMNVAQYVIDHNNIYVFKGYFSETKSFYMTSFGFKKIHYCCLQSKKTRQNHFYELLNCTDDIWYARTFTIPFKILDGDRVIFVQNNPADIIEGRNYLENKKEINTITEYEKERLNVLDKLCERMNELSNPIIIISKIKIYNKDLK